MKKLMFVMSVLFFGQLAVSADVIATPFDSFVRQYQVIGKTCFHNSVEVVCGQSPTLVEVTENAQGTEATVELRPGQSYKMAEYSYAGEYHEYSSARFYDGGRGASWASEQTIGDVANLMIRIGQRIEIEPSSGGADDYLLRFVSYNRTGMRGDVFEEHYVLRAR